MAASELLLGCLLNVPAAHIQLLNKTFSTELITINIYHIPTAGHGDSVVSSPTALGTAQFLQCAPQV